LTGAVTVAIAVSNHEFTGRKGKLFLVGIGPGSLEQITPAARVALNQADAVIGYQLYAQQIMPLLHPGQIVETSPITQERQRAKRAVEMAQWGLTVAMISSGDCGIYGMAGLVMEELESQAWDGSTPSVEVLPGITALQAAAARVGTPLMHDFCAISLSDLLTPLETIRTRLIAAAQADFVTALYNPRSATRTEPMAIAHQIFLEHRHPDTPVALVRSAYRPDEKITLTTLKDLDINQIDMFTTVLIGNATTRFYQGKLITPRAYNYAASS
jgi:cobalt-precorrin 5A hydrolase / precorrin-3B C17-methyltransferase